MQELCKLQQLLLRHYGRELRRSELLIPPLGRRAAADTPAELDDDLDDLDGDLDERLSACGEGEALGLLCGMCLQLLRLPLLPADAAVSIPPAWQLPRARVRVWVRVRVRVRVRIRVRVT